MSFISVTNNLNKKTKLTSIKLEMKVNGSWTEVFLIDQKINSNGFFERKQPGVSQLLTDSFYLARNKDRSICNRVRFYNFQSIARIKHLSSGETLSGWLLFIWPTNLKDYTAINFSSVRYTFVTIQGVKFSKIIHGVKLGKKLGNMTNYFASTLAIENDTTDLSGHVIAN